MIRNYQPKDVNDVIDCAKEHLLEVGQGFGSYDDHKVIQMVKQLSINEHVQAFVLEEDHTVKGYAVCFLNESLWNQKREGCLEYLYVKPECRNGYNSKQLLKQCEQWFEKQNCDYWIASVTAFNPDFTANQNFLDQADQLYGRHLNRVGVIYAKGCDSWADQ